MWAICILVNQFFRSILFKRSQEKNEELFYSAFKFLISGQKKIFSSVATFSRPKEEKARVGMISSTDRARDLRGCSKNLSLDESNEAMGKTSHFTFAKLQEQIKK